MVIALMWLVDTRDYLGLGVPHALREIRYLESQPAPPLEGAQAAWARERLAAFFGAAS